MAEIRRDPRVERRATWKAVARAAFYAALGVAITVVVAKLPADIDADDERTIRRVLGIAVVVAALVAAWFLAVALFHGARWRRARRWERMLEDPATAALVPPTEAHVDAVPEPPGGVAIAVRLVGFSLLTLALLGYGVMALLDRAPRLEYEDGEGPAPGTFIVLAVLALAGAYGAWRSWQKRRIARAVERLSDDVRDDGVPQLHDADVAVERASTIPTLDVIISESGPTRAMPRRVTAEANAFGDPPPAILYLRLFDNERGTAHFLAGPWRELGYVHLLRSATSVSASELEGALQGSGDDMFISSEAELKEVLAAAPRRPEPRSSTTDAPARLLGWIGRHRDGDAYPVYPARQLMCHGGFWKRAVDLLLARVDIVVLDLSGYHREHVGTGYELQRVVDRVPIERVVMLATRVSDERFLRAQVTAAWMQMAAGSPNAGPGRSRSALVDRSDHGDDRGLLDRVRRRQLQASSASGT